MDDIPAGAPDPRPTYNAAFWGTFVGLTVAANVAAILIDRWLFPPGERHHGGMVSVLFMPFMALSAVVATRVCRAAGVSRDARWTDTIRRGVGAASHGPVECELRVSPKVWLGFAWLITVAAAVIAGVVAFIPIKPGEEIYGWLFLAFLSGLAIYFWVLFCAGAGFLGRVDAAGIETVGRFGTGRRRVDWDAVESCEIPTVRNALGRVVRLRFDLKGPGGEVILTIKPFGADEANAEHFRDAVASHLAPRRD